MSCEFQHLKIKLYPYPACIVRSKTSKKVQLNASRLPFGSTKQEMKWNNNRQNEFDECAISWCSSSILPIWIKHTKIQLHKVHTIWDALCLNENHLKKNTSLELRFNQIKWKKNTNDYYFKSGIRLSLSLLLWVCVWSIYELASS